MTACTPKKSLVAQQEAERIAREVAQAEREAEVAWRLAETEQESLNDPNRPTVLHPMDWPEKITVRIVQGKMIIAETSDDPADSTFMHAEAETAEDLWQYDNVMSGAEVALAALGYTLDRFRIYADMDLMVGKFYRKEGPYGHEN